MSVAPEPRVDADAELVEALRREEPDAAEQLVERFGDRVYRLAMRITGLEQDAEEAAQDALWTAARKIHTFKGESAFGSWLYRITANAAYQKLRTRRQKASEIALEDVLPSLDGDGRHFEPMDDWSQSRGRAGAAGRAARGAARRRSTSCRPTTGPRSCCTTSRALSNPEIAETLGISLPAVKSRVHRSRLFVRKRLSRATSRRSGAAPPAPTGARCSSTPSGLARLTV